jgi:hypothetical protein
MTNVVMVRITKSEIVNLKISRAIWKLSMDMFSIIRIFSCDRILKRVCDSKSEIELFLKTKGKRFRQLCDHRLMCDLEVCTDTTQHLNELNITLQERNHLVSEMFDRITAFEKHRLRIVGSASATKTYDSFKF